MAVVEHAVVVVQQVANLQRQLYGEWRGRLLRSVAITIHLGALSSQAGECQISHHHHSPCRHVLLQGCFCQHVVPSRLLNKVFHGCLVVEVLVFHPRCINAIYRSSQHHYDNGCLPPSLRFLAACLLSVRLLLLLLALCCRKGWGALLLLSGSPFAYCKYYQAYSQQCVWHIELRIFINNLEDGQSCPPQICDINLVINILIA